MDRALAGPGRRQQFECLPQRDRHRRAETCLHLEGTLEANDLTLQNCYIGLDVTGTATAEVDTLHVEQADVFAVRNKGTLDLLNQARLHNVSIGLQSEEATYVANLEVEDALQASRSSVERPPSMELTAESNKIAWCVSRSDLGRP